MIHLRAVNIKPGAKFNANFPFNLPLVQKCKEIKFRAPVTFFVGENGSGKSTLLEAIAAGVGSVVVGGADAQRDETLRHAQRLAVQLQFIWQKRTHRGFFLRAEDFFNFARRVNAMSELARRYGEDADARSHGESFLNLFRERFVPGGLYLLDEPEAPLSPQRQLALLSMLKEMVAEDAQFIIATHSPILMAFPNAALLNFDKYPVRQVAYDKLEHVALTKAFLNNPETFLRRL